MKMSAKRPSKRVFFAPKSAEMTGGRAVLEAPGPPNGVSVRV